MINISTTRIIPIHKNKGKSILKTIADTTNYAMNPDKTENKQLASRLLKGKHAFIVATHVDKHHIHSHIIFNSTTLDCTHKYQNPIRSYKEIRELADYICIIILNLYQK